MGAVRERVPQVANRVLYTVALAFLGLVLFAACPSLQKPPLGSKGNPVVMALVPSSESEKLVSTIKPIADYLSRESGVEVVGKVLPTYMAVVEAMGSGQVQIGWLPPLAYVLASDRYGVKVVLKAVRNGKATYQGQILVAEDSQIQKLSDLKGKRIAFVDPGSSSGYLYPRAMLMKQGIDPERDMRVVFAGSHDAAVLALYNGSVDAAACYVDVRKRMSERFPDIFDRTRVLAVTDPIPADSVSVVPDLPPEMEQKLIAALEKLARDPEGRRLIYELYEIEDLVPASDRDFDPVREMARTLGLDLESQLRQKN